MLGGWHGGGTTFRVCGCLDLGFTLVRQVEVDVNDLGDRLFPHSTVHTYMLELALRSRFHPGFVNQIKLLGRRLTSTS